MGRRPKSETIKKKIRRKRLKKILQAPKGMSDIMPEQSYYFGKIIKVAQNLADFYNFHKIELPIIEQTQLFLSGTGKTSEIVQRQMFNFKTPGKDEVSLRPEFTPGIIRAYLQNGMAGWSKPVKLFTHGPLFRYERPQRGRYRQFWQYDFEVIGGGDPIYDALIIQIARDSLIDLKIKDLVVEINTIGCDYCKPEWKKKLKTYFSSKIKRMCKECQRRYKDNILRILDCKDEKCQEFKENAPKMIDYLCLECRKHFMAVLEYLEEINLPFEINNHLVRGLDYYTKTVFEIRETNDNLALCGGGRYDYLVEDLGGKPTSAVGVAVGMERLANILEKRNKDEFQIRSKVFLILLGDLSKKKALGVLEDLRKAGISTSESFTKDSLRAQLKQADKLNVPVVAILGHKEAIDNTIILRDMRSGAQETVKLEKMTDELKKKFKNVNV